MKVAITIERRYEMDADELREYLEDNFSVPENLDLDDPEILEEYVEMIRDDAMCYPQNFEDCFDQPSSVYAAQHISAAH